MTNAVNSAFSSGRRQEHPEDALEANALFTKNVTVRRSLLSEGRKLSLFVLSLLFVDMVAFSAPPWTILRVPVAEVFGAQIGFVIPVLLVLPLGLFLWMLRCVYDRRYVIGPDAITELSGLISLSSRSMRIYYKNVRAMEVEQNTFQRLLGIGSVRIGPMLSGGDMLLSGIRTPEQYRDMIERRMRAMEIAQGEVGRGKTAAA